VVLLLACGKPATQTHDDEPPRDEEPRAMNETTEVEGIVEVIYRHPVGDQSNERLEVLRDGESTLTVDFNYDGTPEIGVWRHRLPREDFDAILRQLDASGWDRLPPPAPMMPGIALTELGVRRAGAPESTTRHFASTPDELDEVTRLLLNTGRKLKAHRYRVLRGQARWKTEGVPDGCNIAIEVTLTNVGVAPLQFTNPLRGRAKEWNGLRITIRRPGSPMGEESFDLDAPSVRMAADAPTTRTRRLGPGEDLAFSVCTKLPGGTYPARLQLHGMIPPSEKQPEILGGMLWLQLGDIKVGPP
jgi:hypothetical protein